MKKPATIILCAIFCVAAVSCRVMKRQATVKVPVTVDEQKVAETEAKNLYDDGKYEDAISYLKALLEKEPKNPVYWSRLGSAYAQQNRYESAVAAYKAAIKFDPKNIKAMYNLSIIYSENGAHGEAQKIVEKALKLNPRNPMLQASLGNVLIDQEKYDKAKKVYEQIVDTLPEFEVGHFNLGVINYEQKNLDAAKNNYEDALKINPADTEAKENLAAIHILKNNYEDAIDYLLDVINSNTGDDITLENAYYNLGVAYLRIKKYKESLASFESAIQIEPWDMAAYVNAAILSEELGMKDKAIKYWQKYDRLLPVNKRKKEIKERLKKLGANIIVVEAPAASTVTAIPADKGNTFVARTDEKTPAANGTPGETQKTQ